MSQNQFLKILEPHISFVKEMVGKYDWPASVKHEFDESIRFLQRRMDDKCVNISVVGEFSSGKSSVINAMLGIDLLAMDDLPDTTLVPSIISYSEYPSLEVVFRDGRTQSMNKTPFDRYGRPQRARISVDDIRDFISQYSFKETLTQGGSYDEALMKRMMQKRKDIADKALAIKCFNIGLPSDFLKVGFRIIDTPGLNSLNADCTRITQEVLAHSDSSIIVGMATDGGLHQEFRENLAEIIGDRMEQCAVVFTHYDHIEPKKRERNLGYLHAVTASYFGLHPDKLLVVPMVPPTLIASLQGRTFGKEHHEMLRVTCDSLGRVLDFAVQQRNMILLKSLQNIVVRILDNLQVRIPELNLSYKKRLSELEKSRTTSLDSFIDAWLEPAKRYIRTEANEYREKMEKGLDEIMDATKKTLEQRILSCSDMTDLQRYMKNGTPYILRCCSKKMDGLLNDGRIFLSGLTKNRLEVFENELQCEFKRLEIVFIPLVDVSSVPIVSNDKLLTSMAEAVQFTDSELEREEISTGLAGAGAIIGSFFGFGVGTLIGASIGALIGTRGRSTSVRSVFRRLKPKYEERLNNALLLQKNSVLSAYNTSVNEYINKYEKQLSTYQQKYKTAIDEMIKDENTRRLAIKNKITQIEVDITEIEKHQKKLKDLWKIR